MNGKHPTSDNISKTAHETVDRIRPSAEQAEEYIREKASRVQDQGQDISETITDFIRERPFVTMGIATVAGLIIGKLLRR